MVLKPKNKICNYKPEIISYNDKIYSIVYLYTVLSMDDRESNRSVSGITIKIAPIGDDNFSSNSSTIKSRQ